MVKLEKCTAAACSTCAHSGKVFRNNIQGANFEGGGPGHEPWLKTRPLFFRYTPGPRTPGGQVKCPMTFPERGSVILTRFTTLVYQTHSLITPKEELRVMRV